MFKISRGLLWVAALALVAFGGVAEAEQKGLEDGEMQLVVGHFTCSQQLAIRQLDGRLFYRGTTGIMADTAGFGVSQIFQDTDRIAARAGRIVKLSDGKIVSQG